MDPSMQWAQPFAPAEPTEMDVENTPAQAKLEEMPPQESQIVGPHDQMAQQPAASQHSSMGYGSFQGSEAEATGSRGVTKAVETHDTEQIHLPEPLSAGTAAAIVDVPSPVDAQRADHAEQGSEQRQGTPADAPAPQLGSGQVWRPQDAPAHMEVDEAAPASSVPFNLAGAGDQGRAGRPTKDAHHEAAVAPSHAVPAAHHPIQAPSSEPNEAMHVTAAADSPRPSQAPSSEPNPAMDVTAADRPIQAPLFEPDKAMHVTEAAIAHPPGNEAAVEQQNVDSEQAHEEAAGTPLAYDHTDSRGKEARGEGMSLEAVPQGKESLESQGRTPASGTPGAAGPAGTGTPRGGVGVASGGRRHVEIKPETDAGAIVWAKTPRYPWWPAQVLSREDPWIPADMEAPRRGAVPVRFFGTYNFAWIESQRALGPWGDGIKDDRATKGKVKVFQDALHEAEHFLATGETPRGFEIGVVLEGGDAPEDGAGTGGSGGHPRAKPRDGRGVSKKDGKSAGLKRREADKAAAAARASAQRKLKAMRKLGLAPPRGSPYGGEPCLDAARNWMGLLQRQLAEQAQRAEARAAAAAAQMRAHEQQVLQHQLMQRKLQEQHVHQLYMEAQRRQHQFLQQQAQQKQQQQQQQQQQGAQVPLASLGQAHVPTQTAAGVRPSPAAQQQPMSSPSQAAFVARPVFTPPPGASVVQTGAQSQAAMNQLVQGMRPALARTGQAPLGQAPMLQPQRPPQPAGPGGPAPSPNRAVPNAGAHPDAAAHSSLAHTLQQLRAMQQQHAHSPQAQNTASVFPPNPAVPSAQQSRGHHAQQPGHQPPSGGHHSQQPGDQQPPRAVGDASEGAHGQGKPPPQLINS